MTGTVAEKLGELRQDHRNMRRLLDVLEREANLIESGADPDYDLTHDVLRYMTGYSDSVHHPKEDRIYARLQQLRPMLAGAEVARVTTEHRDIARRGLALRDALDGIAAGSVMRRVEIVRLCRDYLHLLREHIGWEERELFTLADKLLAAQDWDAIDDGEHHDPLFGPTVERSFRKLYESIAPRGK